MRCLVFPLLQVIFRDKQLGWQHSYYTLDKKPRLSIIRSRSQQSDLWRDCLLPSVHTSCRAASAHNFHLSFVVIAMLVDLFSNEPLEVPTRASQKVRTSSEEQPQILTPNHTPDPAWNISTDFVTQGITQTRNLWVPRDLQWLLINGVWPQATAGHYRPPQGG